MAMGCIALQSAHIPINFKEPCCSEAGAGSTPANITVFCILSGAVDASMDTPCHDSGLRCLPSFNAASAPTGSPLLTTLYSNAILHLFKNCFSP